MKIMQFTCNDWTVLDVEGQFDAEAVNANRSDFNKVVDQAIQGVVVDLTRTSFLDSSGIGALVFMFKLLSLRRKSLILVGVQGQPAKLIQLLRLNRAIVIHASLNAWLASEESAAYEPGQVTVNG